ncbi:velvet factor-domain-containing protein [Mycotypha africana]|uniref:velvet factor-domain-containing protein n=1 Tax=Mycotypha africana TaxID=64632 RepID=UPI0023001476|nr:velvet factor-domain-containing protein [Mycotypha africana]KAI8987332.1 velvet factor-domain-containing protein [Mycotypha africana]
MNDAIATPSSTISSQNTCPFQLILRQQPVHSRMCGIGEKVDRRPIDPPPVVQIKLLNLDHQEDDESRERLSALSTHLFLIAILVPADTKENQKPNILMHSKLTVGRTVSSLYNLRDLDGSEGAFFVFSDISVRTEGTYRLQMCLFDIEDQMVKYDASILTDPFTVYSAKTFPGMYRSCELVQSFARQGLKIRIRREAGPRPARCTQRQKDIRKAAIEDNHSAIQQEDSMDTEEEEYDDAYSQNSSSSSHKRSSTGGLLGHPCSNKRRLSLSYLLLDGEDENQKDNSVKPYITNNNHLHSNSHSISSSIVSTPLQQTHYHTSPFTSTTATVTATAAALATAPPTTAKLFLPSIHSSSETSYFPYQGLNTGAFHNDKDAMNTSNHRGIRAHHTHSLYGIESTAYSRSTLPVVPPSSTQPSQPQSLLTITTATTMTTTIPKTDYPPRLHIAQPSNAPKLPSIQQLVHEKHN